MTRSSPEFQVENISHPVPAEGLIHVDAVTLVCLQQFFAFMIISKTLKFSTVFVVANHMAKVLKQKPKHH